MAIDVTKPPQELSSKQELSLKQEIPKGITTKPVGITTKSGSITIAYVVTCAICQQFEIQSHNSLVSFENALVNENSKWRLSRSSGWVHKSCLKFAPSLRIDK